MKTTLTNDKLPVSFYKRNVLTVARELLGKTLIRKKNNHAFSGIIVETEAYDGRIDEAAHSFKGKTKRNETMFNGAGYLYVYFTYGNHHCCNVVTGSIGDGCAVLIRAVEPISEIKLMAMNRYNKEILTERTFVNLTNGPGKLCKAFSISLENQSTDLTGEKIFILKAPNVKADKISVTKRIGITKSADLTWRFFITNNRFVSKR